MENMKCNGRARSHEWTSLSVASHSLQVDAAASGAMAPEVKYALLESAGGYALFKREEGDEISSKLTDMQKVVVDFTRFARCARAPSAPAARPPGRARAL